MFSPTYTQNIRSVLLLDFRTAVRPKLRPSMSESLTVLLDRLGPTWTDLDLHVPCLALYYGRCRLNHRLGGFKQSFTVPSYTHDLFKDIWKRFTSSSSHPLRTAMFYLVPAVAVLYHHPLTSRNLNPRGLSLNATHTHWHYYLTI